MGIDAEGEQDPGTGSAPSRRASASSAQAEPAQAAVTSRARHLAQLRTQLARGEYVIDLSRLAQRIVDDELD